MLADTANSFEIHRGEDGSGIEAVPAEPEQQATGCGNGEIVRKHGTAAIALERASETRSKDDGTGKRNHAAYGVDNG